MKAPPEELRDDLYAQESYLSLGVIPADEEHYSRLEQALQFQATEASNRKWPRALQWFTNHAFHRGNHFPGLKWNGSVLTGGNVSTDVTDYSSSATIDSVRGAGTRGQSDLPPIIDNQLVRPYAANVSKLSSTRPYPRVIPNSDKSDDEEAAELGSLLILDTWERKRVPARLRLVAGHMVLEGTCAIETQYGKKDIPTIVPEMKEVERPDDLDPERTIRESVATGNDDVIFEDDLRVKVWSGFNMTPDPGATAEPDSETWLLRESFADIGWIKAEFDRDEEGFFPEALDRIGRESGQGTNSPLYWWERTKDLLDTPGPWVGVRGTADATESSESGETILRVYDVKPNEYYPRGRTLITAGHKLIYAGDARAWNERYPERWHPYQIFRYWTSPGSWWGIPLFTQLVPLQKRLNALDLLIRINREYFTLGQWLIPKKCKVPEGTMGGKPGKHIYYTDTPSGAKPEKLRHEPLPGEVYAERDRIIQEIKTKSGTAEALQGEAGSAIRAGIMLDQIKQENTLSQSDMYQGFEEGVEAFSEAILIETSINMVEPDAGVTQRLRVLAREHSELAISEFSGKSLRDNVHVQIDIASQLMQSPEAKKQMAVEALQFAGADLDPAQRASLIRAAGIEDFGTVDTKMMKRARKMVSRIVNGSFTDPMGMAHVGIDDPQVFVDAMTDAVISDEFLDYDKEVKEALFAFLAFYQQQLSEQRSRAQQEMLMVTNAQALAQKGELLNPGGSRNEPRREADAAPKRAA